MHEERREDLHDLMKSLMSSDSNKARSSQSRDPKAHDRTCFNCGNRGHYAKFCPQNNSSTRTEKNMPKWSTLLRNGQLMSTNDNFERAANTSTTLSLN